MVNTIVSKGWAEKLFTGANGVVVGIAIALGLGLSVTLSYLTEFQKFLELDRLGNERLELYASTVEAAQRRFDYLPFIISDDLQVKALLMGVGSATEINRKLQAWQRESNAAELYLMNQRGIVLASSNWQMSDSFVGHDYHFRPYFQDALAGKHGRFFAVGVTTGRPGLFLSRAIEGEKGVLGVAVAKVDMTQLEVDWASGGEIVWVADHNGVIFLASDPEWKYKSLEPLDEQTLERLKAEKKYSDNRITPLSILDHSKSPQGKKIIQLVGSNPASHIADIRQSYMLHSRSLGGLGWSLYYLTSLKGLAEDKRNALLISTLLGILVALLGFILLNRIHNRQLLEQRVASRTKALNESNQRLIDEINGHIKTEEQLRQTHEGLIQAEKLAALGQMSAGLVHEISQPLSALQTFSASTRLFIEQRDCSNALENLDDIDSMVRRVTSIVSHLKSFARKSKGHLTRVALIDVIDNALLIMSPRLAKTDIELNWVAPELPAYAVADEIRLEQVLINLIRNALDAMESDKQKQHRLTIELITSAEKINVYIKDTGCGINPDDLPKVFDPFFTTKETGNGLGLGLSVSYGIVSEFGGELEAIDRPEGGTLFRLTLENADVLDREIKRGK